MKLSLAAFASLYNASAALIFLRATLKESETRCFLFSLVSDDKERGGGELERARGDIKGNRRASVPKRGVVIDRDRHFYSIN